MICACIKETAQGFDFYIDVHEDSLIIKDLSNWQEDPNYTVPDEYELEITRPNGTTFSTKFKPKGITNIELGKCPLEGVYKFKVFSCGRSFERLYAYTRSLECGTFKMKAKMTTLLGVERENIKRQILELDNYISEIKVNTRLRKTSSANDLFKVVRRILEKYNCDCQC